jgi:FAD/FMN-containing dehydrogenase
MEERLIHNSEEFRVGACYSLFMNGQPERRNPVHLPALRAKLQCQVIGTGDEEYEVARRVWNGMIDRKPAVIIQPASIADVMGAVHVAREFHLPVCVRGGGHSVSGKSVADDAMMIDLSLMNGVQVNPGAYSAVVQGGAKWGEFDRECERYQLATTGGVISSTGVGGLTLGGGIGWLMGKHGLSCDNLLSADLVNADGKHMTVGAAQNEELFWAIRGGGGNFGIVTALEFRLHDLRSVHGGAMFYPRSSAWELLRQYRDLTMIAADELTSYAALMVAGGHPMVAVAMCHSGLGEDRAAACQSFRLPDPPVVDTVGEKKYTEIQSMLDVSAPAGVHYYFKCPFLRELSDEVIRTILEFCGRMPSEQTQVIFEHMHGAASRVPVSQTAFALRRVQYSVNIAAGWTDPAMAEICMDWTRELASALEAFGASDAYVNYLGEEESSAVKASYGANYGRLASLKKRYDPDNFFCFNQNIPPAD